MTTGKTIALTKWTFVGKVMSLFYNMLSRLIMGFPGDSVGKESACSAGEPFSILHLGRFPGEGNGNPLQYYCLQNPRNGGAGGLPSMGSHSVRLFFWADSLQMVIAAMKLKDAYSLEGKL